MKITPDTSAEALRSFLLASFPLNEEELVVVKTAPLSVTECLGKGRSNRWPLSASLEEGELPTTFHVLHKEKDEWIGEYFWEVAHFCNDLPKEGCLVKNDYWKTFQIEGRGIYLLTAEHYKGGLRGPSPLQRYFSVEILDASWCLSHWKPQQGRLVSTSDNLPALFIGASGEAYGSTQGMIGSIIVGEKVFQVPMFSLSPYKEEEE